MKGLAGYIDLDGGDTTAETGRIVAGLSAKCHDLAHASWRAPGATLAVAARRNADPSLPGQSLSVTDHEVIAAVAILPNRRDLRTQLFPDTDSASTSDDVLAIAAYRRWGDACTDHLEGVYSLAVWRPQLRQLDLLVDPIAGRPLYYSQHGRRFAFASTLRGLLSLPQLSHEIDRESFAAFVSGLSRNDSSTLYRDARRIPGGHSLTITPAGVRLRRYPTPPPPPPLLLPTDADYGAALRHQLADTVARGLDGTRDHVGLMLSGGLDSSSLAAVAGDHLASTGRRLQAIHVLPRGPGRYQQNETHLDESDYVRQLQRALPSVDFHFLPTTSGPAPREAWDRYFAENCTPFRSLLGEDPAFAAALQARDIRTMMDGTGGNFVFSIETLPSGYLSHLAVSGRALRWWREARGLHRIHGYPWRKLVRHTVINPFKWILRGGPPRSLQQQGAIALLHPDLRRATRIADRLRAHHEHWMRPTRDLRRRLYDLIYELPALDLTTPPSVFAHANVDCPMVRPLFDRRLGHFCLSLPLDRQMRDGWDRRVVREAMHGLLPDAVRLRTTRGYLQPDFQFNLAQATPMLAAELDQLERSPLARELLDCRRLRQIWDRRAVQPSLADDLMAVKTIVAGAFLRWNESGAR